MSDDPSQKYVEEFVEAVTQGTNTRNPQQAEIAEKAEELLAALERLVPTTTIHYAVDEAKLSLRTLVRVAHTIKTRENA